MAPATNNKKGRKRLADMSPEQLAAHQNRVVQLRKARDEKRKSTTVKQDHAQVDRLVQELPKSKELLDHDVDSDDDVVSTDSEGERSDFGEVLEEAAHTYIMAANPQLPNRLLSDEQLMAFGKNSIAQNSQEQYASVARSFEKRGFPVNFRGLASLIACRDDDCLRVANSTMDCYVSAVKFICFTERAEVFTPHQISVLQRLQNARRRMYPDSKRMTGAMTHVRTQIFIEFLKKIHTEGRINKNTLDLFVDAATMLYGGALRFFQLVRLQPKESFNEAVDDKGNPVLLLEIIAKAAEKREATNSAPPVDNKQIHPLYRKAVLDIIQRRGHNTFLFHDFPARRQEFSDLIKECAVNECWPVEHRFSGTHMFRHGAAQDAHAEGNLDLVILRTGHLSKKAAREYARSDAERTSLIEKYKKLDEKARKTFCDDLNKKAIEKSKEALRTRDFSAYRTTQEPVAIVFSSKYSNQENSKKLMLRKEVKQDARSSKQAKSSLAEVKTSKSPLDGQKPNLDVVIRNGVLFNPLQQQQQQQQVNQYRSAVEWVKSLPQLAPGQKITKPLIAAATAMQLQSKAQERNKLEAFKFGLISWSSLPLHLQKELQGGTSLDMAIASRSC